MDKRVVGSVVIVGVVAALMIAPKPSAGVGGIEAASVSAPRLDPLAVTSQPAAWQALAPVAPRLDAAVSRDGGGEVRLPSDGNLLWFHSDTAGFTVPGAVPYLVNNTVAISSPASPLALREPLTAQGMPFQLVPPGPGFTCPVPGSLRIVWISGAVVVPQAGWDKVLLWTASSCFNPADQSSTPYSVGLAEFDYSPTVGADLVHPWSTHVKILSEDLWGTPTGLARPTLGADGMVYVYDCPTGTVGAYVVPVGCRAGRVSPDQVAEGSKYRYWDGATWGATTLGGAAYLDMADTVSPVRYPAGMFEVNYVPAMGLYVLAGQAWPGYNGTSIIRVSQTPQGPWSTPIGANYVGCSGLNSHICYGAEIESDLSDATHLGLVYYDQNGQDPYVTTSGAPIAHDVADPPPVGQTHFISLGVTPPANRAPAISISDVTTAEGNTGTHLAVATVKLSAPSTQVVTAQWATSDVTASAALDYTAKSGTVTFLAGLTTATVAVPIIGNTLSQTNRNFVVSLSAPTNAVITDDRSIVTIVDDDPLSSLTVADTSVAQSTGSTVTAQLTVSLAPASGQTVTVPYATVDGTAVAPKDYQATTGVVTLAPGQTSVTVPVIVEADRFAEPTRSFSVALGAATGATVGRGSGIVTITNTGPAMPTMNISDVTVGEGGGNAVFTVTRSGLTTYPSSVSWTTADGTATAGTDYVAASGTVTFTPGQTVATVTVGVVQGTVNEADETFSVILSNPDAVVLSNSVGTATIVSNVAFPVVSISGGGTLLEGAGMLYPAKVATITVSLSAPSGRTVTVGLNTTPVTADASDFAATSTTVTFDPGQTRKTITIAITQDVVAEDAEQFTVDLSSPTFATIGTGSALVTIVDKVADPTVSISGKIVNESDGTITIALALSAPSGKTITATWATSDFTAKSPTNYLAASGTVTFAPGQTTATVPVTLIDDNSRQSSKTFTIALTATVNASVWLRTAAITVLDSDPPPTVSISDVTMNEGSGFYPTTNAVFTVSLSAPTGYTVTVPWFTADGTAQAPADYLVASGTITFNPNQTIATITVAVVGDTFYEPDQSATVNLGAPTNATIGRGTGTLTIVNDDSVPTVSVTGKTVNEGAGSVTLSVTLNGPTTDAVTVDWSTADQTATSPTNYLGASGTVTFAPGQTAATVTVTVVDDSNHGPSRTFYVNLSAPSNAALGQRQAIVNILDNDPPASVSVYDVVMNEGNGGLYPTTGAYFTITLSSPTAYVVTVPWSTADGTAQAPGDYLAASGTVTFWPGKTTATIKVSVVGDKTYELDETAFVNLGVPTNATIGRQTATLTILNDDPVA